MVNYAILFFVFGVMIILMGIYIYTGHDDLIPRGYYKKQSKAYLRYLGKIIVFVGLSPIISAISALCFEKDSFIPFLVLILSFILSIIISIKYFRGE